ncbi:MAG: hypothetical protein ACREPN_08155 [Rudaea sp.]
MKAIKREMLSKFSPNRVFVAIVAAFMASCAAHQTLLGIEIPASATNVKFVHRSPNDEGITFDLQTGNSSYKYVNVIRKHLIDVGYSLCRKSAISTWQSLPTRDIGQRDKTNYWLIEMYTTSDKQRFALLRVNENLNTNNRSVTQKFLVASQTISSGTPNFANINEFCGP